MVCRLPSVGHDSCTLLKRYNRFKCHLADTLICGYNDTVHCFTWGPWPQRKGKFWGLNPQPKLAVPAEKVSYCTDYQTRSSVFHYLRMLFDAFGVKIRLCVSFWAHAKIGLGNIRLPVIISGIRLSRERIGLGKLLDRTVLRWMPVSKRYNYVPRVQSGIGWQEDAPLPIQPTQFSLSSLAGRRC